jgi:hypothetical protein
MKLLKKALRLFCLILILLLAASGIGISNALSPNRERYSDKEVRIEQVDRKDEEDDEESSEEKN